MNFASKFFTVTLALALCASTAFAQPAPAAAKPAPDATAAKPASEPPCARQNPELCPERTFYLNNVSQQSEVNGIVTALRNTLPDNDKIFLVESENAVVVRATPKIWRSPRSSSTTSTAPKRTIASPTPSLSWMGASSSAPSTMSWSPSQGRRRCLSRAARFH